MRAPKAMQALAFLAAAGFLHVAAGVAEAGGLLDVLVGRGRAEAASLTPNQAVTGLAGQAGTRRYFRLYVAPGSPALTVRTGGGTGDADLYLSHGSLPEPKRHDHASAGPTNAEQITVRRPKAGFWHVLVYGYVGFRDVSLVGSWHNAAIAAPRRDRSVRIISPAPGAALRAGTSHPIRWSTSGHTRRVRVMLSINGSNVWQDITPQGAAPAGSAGLLWTVPAAHGRQAVRTVRLRIVDADAPAISAVSGPHAVVRGKGPVLVPGRRPARPRGSADPYEPNNSSSRASAIRANVVQTHAIRRGGDEDWLVFVPPAPGTYRVSFVKPSVQLKVRVYSAKRGETRENKYRTMTVKGAGHSLDIPISASVRYLKLQVQARDDDAAGAYRVVIQRLGPGRPGRPGPRAVRSAPSRRPA